ncbi:ribokinase [Dyadobacter sp. Leaf189]|uniref:ribokinase n=1 Tax=Dyadobacter sp. Leaf189 TaxID=1736295 RepID=UPI0006FADA69|nr:ribokinase [Dyadobacter sp. Leaf189]KQS31004.1 ribokinase [Dyadobacter sp. Leaf189]
MIYVVGSSNTDMVVKSERLPAMGETVIGGDFLMTPGGKGANQAVAAARLGGNVTFICKVGNDLFGKQALQQFRQEQIHTDFVFTDDTAPSGVALINVDQNGQNCIAVAPGANNHLTPADAELGLVALSAEDILLLQLEIPLTTVETAIAAAHQKGAKIIMNPAPAQNLPAAIYPNIYLITPNETEAALLTGIRVSDHASVEKAAEILLAKGCKNVIITLGSKGAYLRTAESSALIASPKVNATDTTAAGDCFNGALAVALSENMPLSNAVTFAASAAAISVTRMGAQSSMPYRNEIPVN